MLPNQPFFIVETSHEVSTHIAEAFAKAEVRNPVEHFPSVQACVDQLKNCQREDTRGSNLCPVLILLSVHFASESPRIDSLLRQGDRFSSVPLILHGTVTDLPKELPKGVRSTLALPIQLESIVRMVGQAGAQWILRTAE